MVTKMVIKDAMLETVCGITSTFPKTTIPEFAFSGKSNVGKSSLINALMNRKSLARTSGQPGKTQTVNYYKVNNAFYYVDLPGYGYAKVSKEIKAKWGKMIEKYLRMSKMLKIVFLLVDIRHEPGENDKTMYEWVVANGFNPVVVATKLDKISRNQIQHNVKVIRTALGAGADTKIIPFSAETKQGRDELWALIDSYLMSDETKVQELAADAEKADVKQLLNGQADGMDREADSMRQPAGEALTAKQEADKK